jgi:hypothetical protein
MAFARSFPRPLSCLFLQSSLRRHALFDSRLRRCKRLRLTVLLPILCALYSPTDSALGCSCSAASRASLLASKRRRPLVPGFEGPSVPFSLVCSSFDHEVRVDVPQLALLVGGSSFSLRRHSLEPSCAPLHLCSLPSVLCVVLAIYSVCFC